MHAVNPMSTHHQHTHPDKRNNSSISVSLPSSDTDALSFQTSSNRAETMREATVAWAKQITGYPESDKTQYLLSRWLTVASNFPQRSGRNTLLLSLQHPSISCAVTYETWNESYDRRIKRDQDGFFIWSPVIAPQCPQCGNAKRQHDASDCEYSKTPPSDWESGVVGMAPEPVYTPKQTTQFGTPQEERPLPRVPPDDLITIIGKVLRSLEGYYHITTVPPDETHPERKAPRHKTHPLKSHALDIYSLSERVSLSNSPTPSEIADALHASATEMLANPTAIPQLPDWVSPVKTESELEVPKRNCEALLATHLVCNVLNITPPEPVEEIPIKTWYGETYKQVTDRLDRALAVASHILTPIQNAAQAH